MATNTEMNVGISIECGSLGMRNFEDSGTVLYKSNVDGLEFLGTIYATGATLPFNAGVGTNYSAAALETLELYWNQGWLRPLV